MDLLKNWLDPTKNMKPIVIPGGSVQGRVKCESSDEDVGKSEADDAEDDRTYIEEYRRREEQLYITSAKEREDQSLCGIDDDPTNTAVSTSRLEMAHDIFKKYSFNLRRDTTLPIAHYKDQIIDDLSSNLILIIQGPTGCGKTTQVPQYILDHCQENNEYCNIVVTQPRRIAAISVARRVCTERGWAVGTVCGYQVGLENCRNADTVLSYVTTGVLLQGLIKAKNLHNYTHIIIDEIHERTQDMDFLLLLIRKFLYTNSFHVKIILMSATFDALKFSQYFKHSSDGGTIYSPTLVITEKCKYITQTYYVENLDGILKIPNFSIVEPKIHRELFEMLVVLVSIFDNVDKDGEIGSVLVFLPGIYEIEEAYKYLMNAKDTTKVRKWQILPLHSSITNDEQHRVFIPSNPGLRKIILSTNIAESSITVPDITYVIDFCLTKTMVVNPVTKYESLQLQWATHINCTQRAGRVGRVNDGRVYRLVTRRFYEDVLSKDIIPEMVRAPLDRVVLNAKELELNDPPKAILALAIDPPNLSNIQITILYLKEIGALGLTCRGVSTACDGDLTYLGHVMANLPLSVNLSKLIFLGHMFCCLKDCIIMAAGCSLSNIFSTPFNEKLLAYQNKLQWADGSASDLIAYLNLYKVWDMKRMSNAFNRPDSEKAWAKLNYINIRSLNEWSRLVQDIVDRCANLGIKETIGERKVNVGTLENALYLKVCMAGAFYPNYFQKPSLNADQKESEAVKLLGGRDPFKTVYFTTMDKSQPGPLYARRIKELFKFCKGTINISFDNSYRVYVQFNLPTMSETVHVDGRSLVSSMPGKVCKEVYCAVKRRQLNVRNEIPCLPPVESWKLAAELGICENATAYSISKRKPASEVATVLPMLDMQYVKISVTLFIDAGHFWAQNVDDLTSETLHSLSKYLNGNELEPARKEDLSTNDIFACIYDDDHYYRCRIVSNTCYIDDMGENVQIVFIDYGDMRLVHCSSLRLVPPELKKYPPQAMECVLSGVQPSILMNPRALWSDQANATFERYIKDREVYAKVYSVVGNIVHLELYRNLAGRYDNANPPLSFNRWLIREGYAQKAEESYLSKENHMKREQIQSYATKDNIYDFSEPVFEDIEEEDIEPPNINVCTKSFTLKGPFSPLETNLFSMCRQGKGSIGIEGTSVNSVLLETDPQDAYDRLVVAASVGESATSNRLSLRHTTVMPNVLGIPMLMAVIFCPKMEPKPCDDGSQFGAVLCGLGAHETTKQPVCPEHDLEVMLDTELSQELLSDINQLRYWMNMTMNTIECIGKGMPTSVDINVCQRELKAKLEAILKSAKEPITRKPTKYSGVWGKFAYKGDTLEIDDKSLMRNVVWPMHWTMSLREVTQKNDDVMHNIEELMEFARSDKKASDVECLVCGFQMFTVSQVGLHLISESHKQNIAKFENSNN